MNTENNNRIEKYKRFFNKEYLMGPNSLRLLDEMLTKYPLKEGKRVMDLGCGTGLTSMFLAKEAGVRVFATDLWISAAENAERFKNWGIEDQVIPIHADANTLPFAEGYFDAIVSIDAYHYFGTKEGVFTDKILPFLKPGGGFIAAMPGVKEELTGEAAALLLEWMEGNTKDYDTFHCRRWWLDLIGKSEEFEVVMDLNLDCYEAAWNDWFASGHKYGIKDKTYMDRGMDRYLSFIGLVIQRREK